MTKIQKVLRDIENLRDFYKRTRLLRDGIKKKDLQRSKASEKKSLERMERENEITNNIRHAVIQ